MILLQNPSIPVATNAIEIDAAIIDIQSHLDSGLLWLTNGYGRAYKNVDSTQGNTVYYPEVYLGTQNNSQRYTNISPDNDKQGQNFFFVTKETISQFQPGMHSFLSYDTAIIFSVNLELINSALLGTEIYQQILVAQVRDVLTRQLLGSSYQLKINSVDLLFDNVFSEFDLKDAAQLEKAPLSHFRFNCSITLPEACPVPSLTPPPLLGNMSLWLKGDAGINGGGASDGDSVFLWEDQSGNSNHFSQLVAVNQPEYKASLINSRPGIFVNGSEWMQLLSTSLFTNITKGSVWIVGQQTIAPPNVINGGVFWSMDDGSQPPLLSLYTERVPVWGNNIQFYDLYLYKTQTVLPQDNQPHYLGINKDAAGVVYYADSDTLIATNLGVENWDNYIDFYIGDQFGGTNATMIGNICEFIVYDTDLSPTEVTELTSYFNAKYGI